mmetsp:Transcript_36168/g.94806  ORF Transcript_36168/g.94806 Transcript_36168/m.94806 type:complete len:281 (+) Transcript_36168:934-1776(+)
MARFARTKICEQSAFGGTKVCRMHRIGQRRCYPPTTPPCRAWHRRHRHSEHWSTSQLLCGTSDQRTLASQVHACLILAPILERRQNFSMCPFSRPRQQDPRRLLPHQTSLAHHRCPLALAPALRVCHAMHRAIRAASRPSCLTFNAPTRPPRWVVHQQRHCVSALNSFKARGCQVPVCFHGSPQRHAGLWLQCPAISGDNAVSEEASSSSTALAMAAGLSRAGMQVLVCERHSQILSRRGLKWIAMVSASRSPNRIQTRISAMCPTRCQTCFSWGPATSL